MKRKQTRFFGDFGKLTNTERTDTPTPLLLQNLTQYANQTPQLLMQKKTREEDKVARISIDRAASLWGLSQRTPDRE